MVCCAHECDRDFPFHVVQKVHTQNMENHDLLAREIT
jgi:hypothetical protein